MSQEHYPGEDAQAAGSGELAQQQQQQQPQPEEGHAGQGAESVMKQLREWERRRSSESGGKRRHTNN